MHDSKGRELIYQGEQPGDAVFPLEIDPVMPHNAVILNTRDVAEMRDRAETPDAEHFLDLIQEVLELVRQGGVRFSDKGVSLSAVAKAVEGRGVSRTDAQVWRDYVTNDARLAEVVWADPSSLEVESVTEATTERVKEPMAKVVFSTGESVKPKHQMTKTEYERLSQKWDSRHDINSPISFGDWFRQETGFWQDETEII